MPEVNESIVKRYFELKGYMVTTNIGYSVIRQTKNKKKGSGVSDIDLAIVRPDLEDRAIVEVKGWHMETLTPGYLKDINLKKLTGFISKEALESAEKFFKSKKFRKILVISSLSKIKKNREKVIEFFKNKGVDLLEFKDILKYMIGTTSINRHYRDSECQQTIRIFKIYNLLKEEGYEI